MSTEKSRAANRANARKSTGPRSATGKKVAASNALAHGLCAVVPVLPGESAAGWEAHRTGIHTALAPSGGLEAELSDRVAVCLWRLRRVVAYETAVTACGLEEATDRTVPDDDPFVGLGETRPRSDAERLARVEKKLPAAREKVLSWGDTFALLGGLADLPDDTPVTDSAVEGALADLACAAPGDDMFETDDPAFLTAVGVPAEHHGNPPGWPGWTAGVVRRAAEAIAARAGGSAADLIAHALADRGEYQKMQTRRVAELEAQAAGLRDRISRQAVRAVVRKGLPDADTLDKVSRYESHLSRQMLQALNTLERLQAARAGKDVTPPVAGTLVVDHPLSLAGTDRG